MHSQKLIKVIKLSLVTLISFICISCFNLNHQANASIQMKPAYDLSQWQKSLTLSQVQQLKNETSFLILRAQYGSTYQDQVINNNIKLVEQVGIPYGVYSYSRYTSANDASTEAQSLYKIAPNANFYVNDLEENDVTSGTLTQATQQWATTMRTLTNKPIVLYSGLYFMNTNLQTAKSSYDALWIASYGSGEPNPNYSYDLWQYTDKARSNALNQNVDASIIPDNGKPLSFWTSGTHTVTNTNTTNSNTNQNTNSNTNQNSTSQTSANSNASSNSASSQSSTSSSNSNNPTTTQITTSNTDNSSSSNNIKTAAINKTEAANKAAKEKAAKVKAAKLKAVKEKAAKEKAAKLKAAKEKATKLKAAKAKAAKLKAAKEKAAKLKAAKAKAAKYYTELKTYQIKVTNKSGIYIYDNNNHKVQKLKHGQKIYVSYVKYVNGTSQIILPNGNHITSSKSSIIFV